MLWAVQVTYQAEGPVLSSNEHPVWWPEAPEPTSPDLRASRSARLLEALLLDATLLEQVRVTPEARRLLDTAVGASPDDTYATHLSAMLAALFKVPLHGQIAQRVASMGESDARKARQLYVRRARWRVNNGH
jgi:hypothetical protein